MGFWISSSFLAVSLLLVGFRRTTGFAEKRSILSCAIFIALNLAILAIIGPTALEILVSSLPVNAIISITIELNPLKSAISENFRRFSGRIQYMIVTERRMDGNSSAALPSVEVTACPTL